MSEHAAISGTLERIHAALGGFVAQGKPRGLLNGTCGVALFYAYYFRLTQREEHLDSLRRVIEKSVAALAVEEPGHSHCSGLAGIAWCIQHLINQGFIERAEADDIFEHVDRLLVATLDRDLGAGHHDFLHEGLGIALYFLEKLPDPAARAHLERAAARLDGVAARAGEAIRWPDRFTRRGQDGGDGPTYNLGLAHGTPAILSILALLHEHGIATARVAPLIRGAVRWMRGTRNAAGDDRVSLYPTMVDAHDRAVGSTHSRLGWCYGDLPVALALLNTGVRLQDPAYVQEARAILEHTSLHRTAENGAIADAALCHGSMGISHIFRRAYLATGDDAFLRAADRWLRQTLELGTWGDGVAGFKYWRSDGHVSCFDLLQGVTGIGLALIAALDRDTVPAWDRCLLVS